jgi:hypothetical protein
VGRRVLENRRILWNYFYEETDNEVFFYGRMIKRDVLLTSTVNKYLKILTNEERCGLKVVAVDRSQ